MLVHSSLLLYLQPVPDASKFSSIVHKRAPAPSQKSLASDHITSPLHSPLGLVSPHTAESPLLSALFQPKSSQLDADFSREDSSNNRTVGEGGVGMGCKGREGGLKRVDVG